MPTVGSGAGSRSLCHVQSVHDGDTIHCAEQGKVRILLIDTPETREGPPAQMATARLRELLRSSGAFEGVPVELEADATSTDVFDRALAHVFLPDGRLVSEELAADGMAMGITCGTPLKYSDRVFAAIDNARDMRRGLWSDGEVFDRHSRTHRLRCTHYPALD
jgi:micrococcal nuclease